MYRKVDDKMFWPVGYKRASEDIMEQILSRIEEGVLKEGDKLDSEGKLAMEFGVSKPCVREALRALELMGVIRVERGKGAFILGSSIENSFSIWTKWAHFYSAEVIEVLEVRDALEAKIVSLVSEKHKEIDFSEIEEIIDKMRTCARKPINYELASKLDTQFHVLLG